MAQQQAPVVKLTLLRTHGRLQKKKEGKTENVMVGKVGLVWQVDLEGDEETGEILEHL